MFRTGDQVVMHGLQVRPEFNGRQGTLGVFVADTGLWPVILTDETVAIKAENLCADVAVGSKRKVPEAASPAPVPGSCMMNKTNSTEQLRICVVLC